MVSPTDLISLATLLPAISNHFIHNWSVLGEKKILLHCNSSHHKSPLISSYFLQLISTSSHIWSTYIMHIFSRNLLMLSPLPLLFFHFTLFNFMSHFLHNTYTMHCIFLLNWSVYLLQACMCICVCKLYLCICVSEQRHHRHSGMHSPSCYKPVCSAEGHKVFLPGQGRISLAYSTALDIIS